MRCSSCSSDTPGKTLKGNGYRCLNCGHQFVAIKKTDGLSDSNIRQAIVQVSDNDKLYYLSDHLSYQLQRRLARNRRAVRTTLFVIGVVLGFIALVLFLSRRFGWGILALVVSFFSFRGRKAVVGTDVFSLVNRFEAVNPPTLRVPATQALLERERGRDQMLAALRGAGRILVCQHRRDAEFLIANDFHLKHACPVAGPDGLALDGFPELETRIAKAGALDLFVLHDFTPGGAAFTRRVHAMPGLSKRRDSATVIDMGFAEKHRPLLATALRPLDRIPLSRDPRPGERWPDNLGAQVTAMRPALLLAAAGRSIEERAPMRATGKDDDATDSSDSDEGDSE